MREAEDTDCLYALYIKACQKHEVKPNSYFLANLPRSLDVTLPCIIDLSGNYVGNRGILPVLDLIAACPHVTTFIVAANGLRNAGVESMCRSFAKHPSIRYIDLSNNVISAGAATALVALLSANSRIRRIVLHSTKVDAERRLVRLEQLFALLPLMSNCLQRITSLSYALKSVASVACRRTLHHHRKSRPCSRHEVLPTPAHQFIFEVLTM